MGLCKISSSNMFCESDYDFIWPVSKCLSSMLHWMFPHYDLGLIPGLTSVLLSVSILTESDPYHRIVQVCWQVFSQVCMRSVCYFNACEIVVIDKIILCFCVCKVENCPFNPVESYPWKFNVGWPTSCMLLLFNSLIDNKFWTFWHNICNTLEKLANFFL